MCWCCEKTTGGDPYKNFRRGGVEVEDFADEFRYAKSRRKKKARKTRAGCPENGFKSHVYVWTTELNRKTLFSDYYGFHAYERRVCAGCGKVSGSRRTAAYEKVKVLKS